MSHLAQLSLESTGAMCPTSRGPFFEFDLACEYLRSRETVTNTRLRCLADLSDVVSGGRAVREPAVARAIIDAIVANLPVGNIRVRRESLVLLGHVATSLGGYFVDYLAQILPHVVERLGDQSSAQRMVGEAAAELFTVILAAVGPAKAYEALLEAKAFSHKSWRVRERLFMGLAATLSSREHTIALRPHLDALLALTLTALTDRGTTVRDAAVEVLVRLYGHIGEALHPELQKSSYKLRDAQIRTLHKRFALVQVTQPPLSLRPAPTAPSSSGGGRRAVRRSTRPATADTGTTGRGGSSGGSSFRAAAAATALSVRCCRTQAELTRELDAAEAALDGGTPPSGGLEQPLVGGAGAAAVDWRSRLDALRRLCAVFTARPLPSPEHGGEGMPTAGGLGLAELLWNRGKLR